MLSHDEIDLGMTFILKLRNAAGHSVQWVETLRGMTAQRWYEIYRTNDWKALQREASLVFTHPVTPEAAERERTSRRRCVYIHTPEVLSEDLATGSHAVETLVV